MATVHYGRLLGPAGFSRVVAIKRLHPQLAREGEFVSMFLDEVRLAARVQHPNVVATLDVVEENEELFLVMEYVHGESLAHLIRAARAQGQHVPPEIASSVVCGLLHGLHAAHEATSETGDPLGIIHRDVSPQNVLVGSDGVARVLDFGVARAARRIQNTREGQLKGKAGYLAPERIHGYEADRRSDVYGAAVVLWETLTGMRLFDGENDAAILAQIVSGQIEPPSKLVQGIPPALEAITMRGMDLDPEQRFATAREMALALQQEVGIVAPSEVGDWVASIASERLADRTRTLAQLDSVALPDGTSPRESNGPPGEPHTRPVPVADRRPTPGAGVSLMPTSDAPSVVTNEPAPSKKRGRVLVALLLAASAAASVFLLRPKPIPVVRMVAPAAEPVPAAPAAAPPAMPAIAEKVEPAEPIKTAEAPVGKPRGRAPRPGAPAPRNLETDRPVSAPVEAAPRDPCKPPYTIDSAGVKHYKVDCVIDGRR
jgi:serine/threonine-protein kinase